MFCEHFGGCTKIASHPIPLDYRTRQSKWNVEQLNPLVYYWHALKCNHSCVFNHSKGQVLAKWTHQQPMNCPSVPSIHPKWLENLHAWLSWLTKSIGAHSNGSFPSQLPWTLAREKDSKWEQIYWQTIATTLFRSQSDYRRAMLRESLPPPPPSDLNPWCWFAISIRNWYACIEQCGTMSSKWWEVNCHHGQCTVQCARSSWECMRQSWWWLLAALEWNTAITDHVLPNQLVHTPSAGTITLWSSIGDDLHGITHTFKVCARLLWINSISVLIPLDRTTQLGQLVCNATGNSAKCANGRHHHKALINHQVSETVSFYGSNEVEHSQIMESYIATTIPSHTSPKFNAWSNWMLPSCTCHAKWPIPQTNFPIGKHKFCSFPSYALCNEKKNPKRIALREYSSTFLMARSIIKRIERSFKIERLALNWLVDGMERIIRENYRIMERIKDNSTKTIQRGPGKINDHHNEWINNVRTPLSTEKASKTIIHKLKLNYEIFKTSQTQDL